MTEEFPKESSGEKKEEEKQKKDKKIYQDPKTGQVISKKEWEEIKNRDDWREQA